MLGPEYALLQPDYASLHERIPPREGPVRRILIFFSGTDTYNVTGKVLSVFLRLNRPDILVDVVVPSGCPHASVLRSSRNRLRILLYLVIYRHSRP